VGSDVLQEFCGALRVVGGVTAGEVGDANTSAKPVAASAPRSLRPTTATTGVDAARSTTAAGSFPCNVW
jgi:hypothetical protein